MRHRTSSDRGTEANAVAAAGIALALVALVALCSSSTPWRAGGATGAVSDWVLVLLGAAGAVSLVAGVLFVWAATPPDPRRPRTRRLPKASDFEGTGAALSSAGGTAAALLLVVGVLLLVALPFVSGPERSTGPEATPASGASAGSTAGDGSAPARTVELGWLVLALGVSVTVLLPVAVVLRRRRFAHAPADNDEPERLGEIVRTGIAELESVRDPRQAVLRAYARMEEVLAAREIVRAPDETASELLSRTVRRLPAGVEQAGWLTGAFEEARFSTHEITEQERARALASLRSIERELAEAHG